MKSPMADCCTSARERRTPVLMIQSDGLHFMLMHSNHVTLMSPSHHCFHCFKMIPNMWPRFVTRWISCNVLAVHRFNPGQVPVLTIDQPLFTIAKQIQWHWPDVYGEEKFVILLGGLHIEIAALTTHGYFLDGSGWTHALTQADLATAGKADSFLNASHVKRTRQAHQVTASALSILMHNAYDTYVCEEIEPIPFDESCKERVEASPQFQYWFIVMQLELLVLVYVRWFIVMQLELLVLVYARWFIVMQLDILVLVYVRWFIVMQLELLVLVYVRWFIVMQMELLVLVYARWFIVMQLELLVLVYVRWFIVMQLELLVLVCVRSQRDANFLLYVAVLEALTPKHLHSSIRISLRLACRL